MSDYITVLNEMGEPRIFQQPIKSSFVETLPPHSGSRASVVKRRLLDPDWVVAIFLDRRDDVDVSSTAAMSALLDAVVENYETMETMYFPVLGSHFDVASWRGDFVGLDTLVDLREVDGFRDFALTPHRAFPALVSSDTARIVTYGFQCCGRLYTEFINYILRSGSLD